MPAFNKSPYLTQSLAEGKINFATNTFKVSFSNGPEWNSGPTMNFIAMEFTSGYPSGGYPVTVTRANAAGVETISVSSFTMDAVGGTIGNFSYATLYATDSTPPNCVVGYFTTNPVNQVQDTDPALQFKFNNTDPGKLFTIE